MLVVELVVVVGGVVLVLVVVAVVDVELVDEAEVDADVALVEVVEVLVEVVMEADEVVVVVTVVVVVVVPPPPPPPLIGIDPIAKLVPVSSDTWTVPAPEPVLHMVEPVTMELTITQEAPFQNCMTDPLVTVGSVKQRMTVPVPGSPPLTWTS